MLSCNIFKKLFNFDLNLEFNVSNEILVFFGPSGCGKTTTLKIIAGLKRMDKGYVCFDGKIFDDTDKKIFVKPQERKFSMMFQDYALFPHMSVFNNIIYGVKNSKDKETIKRAEELLEKFNIKHLRNLFPLKISGGERQRVALARALMTEPNLILLDEPLSALDYEIRLKLGNELRSFQKDFKIPFLLVTHDHEEAKRIGDRILYISSGKIIKETPVEH
ncbi:molybdate transport system ATP-binding protein [Thermodesulfobium acidiphilum]|uniref:Molybdate transport system ATP-binding protein n=1 Tax=Thermodesulfobium acidiphilum TaxID=1794699 RepID=A0A2R4W2Y8_THEAF|nr:ATP-binding cassette domain-containing protein [Thermodesulfobium acidiphilum]AWB11135.1 molybdate transport system ATP-binding protein [Thermodesulfobium acidiphilum]